MRISSTEFSTRCSRSGSAIALLFALFLGVSAAPAVDYFVRNDGTDANSGRSTNAAWRTIDRVNQASLHGGDRVLFEPAQSFAGNLVIRPASSGSAENPIIIESAGADRATIAAGQGTGIVIENTAGIVLRNLIVTGSGRTNNTGYGLRCDNTRTNENRLRNLRIENIEVSGFGIFGILVSGDRAGFEHVVVTNCVMRDNLRGGMEIAGRLPWDSPLYAHADVRVTHCQAFDNTGDPEFLKNHSGSGMVLYQVDGGIIDHCRAWNNGALCQSKGGGGVGIWTCASRRVVIEHCESFCNRTSARDGGGFDIDGGSTECVLQFNFSHDNDGPGLMAYTYPYASHSDSNNVIRFNISDNDSRKSRGYAGLWVRNDGQGMTGLEVYNNTVRVGGWADQAAFVHGDGVQARFRNNLLISSESALPLIVEKGTQQLRFEQNCYWREGAPVAIRWNDRIHASLASWRVEVGQESLTGNPLGFFADPKLTGFSAGQASWKQGDSASILGFRPFQGSTLLSAGLEVPFGPESRQTDFLGFALNRTNWPIGAFCSSAGQ